MRFSKEQLINFDPNIEDQTVLHIDRLPPRATVIPADKRGVYYRNKDSSAYLRSLNGDYKFKYLLEDTFKEFYSMKISDDDWDTIDVPSMWQYRGYGKPEYPNVKYSIPVIPPYVKKQNPVGLYRRSFNVSEPAERTLLHFSGVDNAFYVYLNGKQVGFSKGSRLPAEFDVTALVRKGENLLAVKVFTYSDATYLENQDMLLSSGIFRDVYLIETRKNTLWDYRVTTTKDTITVSLKLSGDLDYRVRLTLDGESVVLDAERELTYTFKMSEPRLWNAEEPNLYDLYIELMENSHVFETHSKRVGIMETHVEGNKLLVNGKPIYIKGVNRHENNAKNGRTMTARQIEADLRMIKENNLNAIRLSHYTNDPTTYEIASEIGLYLMDEADLETHGAHVINGDQGYLSKSPEWFSAYRDRIVRMLEMNKNEVCIFIRSTGNECGRGENLEKLVDIIREFDPTRECYSAQDPGEKVKFRGIGYYPMSVPEEMSDEGYPIIAIEYAHAMGNSPGTLEDYWDYNYTHEKMLGGFVWEFRSHGFYAEDENGRPFYKYGGDFDDIYHWNNFSMDGFCMSDGTPKPGWFELGQVSFAAYVTFDGQRITVKNTNDFRTLSYLTASYEICEDGIPVKSGAIELPEIRPHESYSPDIDISVDSPIAGARYFLNIYFSENGVRVHTKQFSLGALKKAKAFCPKAFKYSTSVENYILKVEGADFSAEFTKGMLSRLEKKGKLLLDGAMKLNFFRAHTDNDGIRGRSTRHLGEWEKALIDKYYFNLFDISVKEDANKFIVETLGRMTTDSVHGGFACRICYEVYSGGDVLVDIKCEPYGNLPPVLPRMGVVFPISKSFGECRWLGRGARENYCDMKAAAPVGIYTLPIEQMNIIYDYPQETGNRENTYIATLLDGNGRELSIVGSDLFSFSYHDMDLHELDKAAHKNEISRTSDHNYLYIDYRMRGLGSHSCGPDPEEKYELHPHSFELAFVISGEADRAVELSRLDFGRKTQARSDTYVSEPIVKIKQIADCDI